MSAPRDVAFDIETLGLMHESPLPEVTCVCMYDGVREWSVRTWRLPPHELAKNRQLVVDVLDGAARILGYNAVLFDLEFLRRSWGIDDARMLRWQLKCVDPYQTMRLLYGAGGKLQTMLTLNDLGSKTGTGGDAITLARADEWDELLAYCLVDARLTYELVHANGGWPRVTPSLECSWACSTLPSRPSVRFRGVSASSSTPPKAPRGPVAWPMLPLTPPPLVFEDDD